MKNRIITLLGILLLAVLVVSCGASTTAQPAATTAVSGIGSAANSAGPQGTSQAVNAKNTAASAAAQGTPQAATAGSGVSAAAPTAVSVPVIVQPTPLPAAQPSANSGTTASAAPASTAPRALVTPAAAVVTAPSLQDLKGKIIFFSDRSGGYPELWVMNADGSNQQLCNCSDVLQMLVTNETISPDKQQFLYVKTVGSARNGDIQIWRHNNANNTDEPLTGGAPGFPGVDYQPVWSPDSKHIAWVTEVNGYDEIYLYDASENSNVRLTQSRGEWYKHPSFSPDGSHITYWSNLGNLNFKQIWTMNVDGSGKVNLSNNAFNDWDAIWVK
jgi:Tol biopolymer transport system component